jgi:glycine cleavage system T protein
MKKLPLYDTHLALGANFTQKGDWLIPEDYGDTHKEYQAVRNGIGISDLSHRGKLRLSGKDHLKFLQGMLTNDVMKLDAGKGMYAAILTVKGRMVSDMKVYREEDSVLLDLEPGLNIKVGELLKKYRLSYKADIDDLTEDVGLFSIDGPGAKELLFKVLAKSPGDMGEYDHFRAGLGGKDVTVVKDNRTPMEGYDIYMPREAASSVWNFLVSGDKELGVTPSGFQAMNILRVEAGIPLYGVDMDENNIPIEAGLWNALNFEKGCYVGQEVVARIKWRGHVNWHLMGFVIEGQRVPLPGDGIFLEERKIGRVTSGVSSAALDKPLALGYIRREFKEPGTKVTVKSGEGLLPDAQDDAQSDAIVSDLPF